MWIVLTRDQTLAQLPAEANPRPGTVLDIDGRPETVERVLDGPDAPELITWLTRLKARLVG